MNSDNRNKNNNNYGAGRNNPRRSNANDEYEREYREQLNAYERMSGKSNSNRNNDLQFHQHDEYYDKYNPNGQIGEQQYTNQPYSNDSYGNANQSGNRQRSNSGSPQRHYSPQQSRQRNSSSNKRKPQPTNSRKPTKQRSHTNTARPNNKKDNKIVNNSDRKRHPVKTVLIILIILVLILFIAANLLLWHYIGLVNTVKSGTRNVTDAKLSSSDVENILVIGSDTRQASERGRTDSMILISINKSTKEITMTSFMRDMYVHIPNYDVNGDGVCDKNDCSKLNAAYVYGGAEMLMDTIQENFEIAVDKYVYVNFYSFIDIVDSLGGLDIKISAAEAKGMQAPTAEQNKYLKNKKGTDYLSKGGTIHMNGNQALAYARLRYVGNADFQRTERQRLVISKIITKVKSSSPLVFNSFANSAFSKLTTNMTKNEMYALSYKVLFSMNYKQNSLRIPPEDYYTYGTHSGQSTLDVDFDKCIALLNKKIYHQ